MAKRIITAVIIAIILALALVAFSACTPEEPTPNDPTPDAPAPELPDLSGIALADKTVTYDGEKHSLAVSGTLPDGIEVIYEGNGKTEAGEYTVTAKFYQGGEYLKGKDLTAKLIIGKARIDLSAIIFADKTVTYDGKEHNLAVSGTLPAGVTAAYEGNGKSEVGEYTVTVRFGVTSDNYVIDGAVLMTAKLVITAAADVIPDLSGITLADKTVSYNGRAQSLAVSGALPGGITVTYEGNGGTDVGTYTVVAKLYYNGEYIEGGDLSATLVIKAAEISIVDRVFANKTVTYNGKPHSVELAGTFPEGVTVSYEGNGQINVGTYTVTARVSVTDDNYVIVGNSEKTATLTINKAVIDAKVDMSKLTFTCDGEKKYPEAVTLNTELEGVSIVTVGAGQMLPGTYKVTYKFVIDPSVAENITPHDDIEVNMVIGRNIGGTAGLTFAANANGTYYVDGYTGTDSAVFIPATYNGKAVTAIAGRAFENKTFIKYISVPDSVKSIGQSAMRGCTSIEAITLPFVGGSAGSSNSYLGFIFGASGYAGNRQFVPASLKTVDISAACTLIPAYSFYDCEGITEIRIGSGVEEIGSSAFRGCTSLKGIFLPENVDLIRAAANNYNSPFFELADDFVIYLGASSVSSGFASKWNVLDSDGGKARVEVGKTYQDYLDEVLK